MGWFRNSNNTGRVFNNLIIDNYGQKLGEKLSLLKQQKETASTAASAIDTLIAMGALKHPTITTKVQEIGTELLAAQKKVKEHLDEINLMMMGTQLEMGATLNMLENYTLPRIQRNINLSGLEMADLAIKGFEELEVQIPTLQQKHDHLMSKTQETTQKAYEVLKTN